MKPNFPVTAAILAAITIPILSLLWRSNEQIAILFLALSIVTLWVKKSRSDLIHYIVAAILGPTMEAVCIYAGAWQYGNPTLLIPYWLPLGWGLAAVIIKNMVDWSRQFIKHSPNQSKSFPTLTFLVFLLSVASISIFWVDGLLVTGMLVGLTIVMIIIPRFQFDPMKLLFPFVSGPIMEIICISFGTWQYTNPFVIIPLWLPFIWGIIMLTFSRISEFIIEPRRVGK
jgi:hypothetical protein